LVLMDLWMGVVVSRRMPTGGGGGGPRAFKTRELAFQEAFAFPLARTRHIARTGSTNNHERPGPTSSSTAINQVLLPQHSVSCPSPPPVGLEPRRPESPSPWTGLEAVHKQIVGVICRRNHEKLLNEVQWNFLRKRSADGRASKSQRHRPLLQPSRFVGSCRPTSPADGWMLVCTSPLFAPGVTRCCGRRINDIFLAVEECR